jgi:hypothetical protein
MQFFFICWGGEKGGKWEYNIVSFLSLAKQNVHTDVLCLKDKTALVCYNVTLVKISVNDEKKKNFVIILNMTKFKIQAVRV